MANISLMNTANFSGGNNSGIQVGQNLASIHVHQPAADFTVEDRCRQLFWLPNDEGSGYEWYKNRIAERVSGTCEWFLNHPNYHTWRDSNSGLLLVSADPGCGKSVLAKHLIDHELPGPMCYFFFKDKDQDTLKKALCALLHQVMRYRRSMVKHALPDYQAIGPALVDSTDVLWKIFLQILRDTEASSMTFVLDALDECVPRDARELVERLVQFINGRPQTAVKFLLTTRPYENTLTYFGTLVSKFSQIRIPGEEFSSQLGEEVNRVIKHRTECLAQTWGLRPDLAEHMEESLLAMTHRTYLWVYLVFESIIEKLSEDEFKKTKTEINKFIDQLPQSVNDIYVKILSRPKNQARLRKVLSIIVGARRPLHVDELNIALATEPFVSQSFKSLDLESKEDFQIQLRNWCGLFISIDDERVYLLHQTAREFLLSHVDEAAVIEGQRWQGPLALHECHRLLANICLTFVCFPQFDTDPAHKFYSRNDRIHEEVEVIFPVRSRSFFEYAACFWTTHTAMSSEQLHPATSLSTNTLRFALHACSLYEHMPRIWFRVYRGKRSARTSASLDGYSRLMVATATGLHLLVRPLLGSEEVNYRTHAGTSALSIAVNAVDKPLVTFLIGHGARATLDMVDTLQLFRPDSSPTGYEIVQLLVKEGVDLNSTDRVGKCLLHSAVKVNTISACQFLLDQGAEVNHFDQSGQTPLHLAAEFAGEQIVQLLLDHKATIDIRNPRGETPLHYAVHKGNDANVRLLLNKGASVHARDDFGGGSLILAVRFNRVTTAQLLLDYGANVHIDDNFGDNPLLIALENNNTEMIQLFLEHGDDIDDLDC